MILAGGRPGAEEGTWHNLIGCSAGGDSVYKCIYILLIHVDDMLFYSYMHTYTYLYVERTPHNISKILIFLDFFFFLVVWYMGMTNFNTLLAICKYNFMMRCWGQFSVFVSLLSIWRGLMIALLFLLSPLPRCFLIRFHQVVFPGIRSPRQCSWYPSRSYP